LWRAGTFASEVLEGRDVVVGQQRRELLAPIEGQDGIEGVELLRTPQHIARECCRMLAVPALSHRFAAAIV
jgi:hypothetical protein